MKLENNRLDRKEILSKCIPVLFMLSLISIFSCTTVQYGFDARNNSKFSSFESLGITKEDFIKQFGLPTNKGMYQETPVRKVEKLYYTEQIRNFMVTTEFVFENGVLKKMWRVEPQNKLEEFQEKRKGK